MAIITLSLAAAAAAEGWITPRIRQRRESQHPPNTRTQSILQRDRNVHGKGESRTIHECDWHLIVC